MKQIDYVEVKRLYDTGMNDCEISRKLGCCTRSVRLFRKRNNLESNHIPLKQVAEEFTAELSKYATDKDKPWHDPESLFCDGDFLEQLTGKKIKTEMGREYGEL